MGKWHQANEGKNTVQGGSQRKDSETMEADFIVEEIE
jgi:hypothetical protein